MARLTQEEERFLKTLPHDDNVEIEPYNPRARKTADAIVRQLQEGGVRAETVLLGALAFEIAGTNGVDLYVFSDADSVGAHLPKMERLFGHPKHKHPSSAEWSFVRDGFDVELYL